jgi:hypothetical protein
MCEETENNMYSINPHTLVELKYRICEIVSSVEVSKLKLVSDNLFMRLEVCLGAEGRHFEHLM